MLGNPKQDSPGVWIPSREIRIPGTGFRVLCQQNLDSGFQSLVGLRISQAKISRMLESGFPYTGLEGITASLHRCNYITYN